MPVIKFTESAIAKLRPVPGAQLLFFDRDLKGFGVLVSPGGSKSYVAQGTLPDGRKRRITVGPYREGRLEEARDLAWTVLTELRRALTPRPSAAPRPGPRPACKSPWSNIWKISRGCRSLPKINIGAGLSAIWPTGLTGRCGPSMGIWFPTDTVRSPNRARPARMRRSGRFEPFGTLRPNAIQVCPTARQRPGLRVSGSRWHPVAGSSQATSFRSSIRRSRRCPIRSPAIICCCRCSRDCAVPRPRRCDGRKSILRGVSCAFPRVEQRRGYH